MDPLIGDLWGVIEPDLEPAVEVLEGVELGAFEEIVPDEAEGFLFFPLSIRIPSAQAKGSNP